MYWVSESDTQVFPAIVADGARCLPLRLPCVFGLETRVWWNTTSHAGHHVPITHGVERCGLHFTVYDPSRRSKSTVVMIDAFLFVTLCVHPQTWPPDSFEVAFFWRGVSISYHRCGQITFYSVLRLKKFSSNDGNWPRLSLKNWEECLMRSRKTKKQRTKKVDWAACRQADAGGSWVVIK